MKGLSFNHTPVDFLMPVGAIYLSVDGTNPSTLFGGTWEQIKDKFILCAGSTYANGATGGSSTHLHATTNHTLTINEIPSHTHGMTLNSYADNNYSGGFAWNYGINNSGYFKGGNSYILFEGGSAAHNHGNTSSSSNLPPYIAVTVWKRTA